VAWHVSPVSPTPLVSPALPALSQPVRNAEIRLTTTSASYFARNESGDLLPTMIDGKRYFLPRQSTYAYRRTLSLRRTALIVMDPWEDAGSEQLTRHFRAIQQHGLQKLIVKSIDLGLPVIVLTNAPRADADYGSAVAPEIRLFADHGAVKIVFHETAGPDAFTSWLKSMKIDTLIYSGFASNVCVIGRELGMISMQQRGFRLFFVPDASAAVEESGTWETGEIHRQTTRLISNWIAELIDLGEFLNVSAVRP
jgi:nicotinamidase-related amidase